MPRPTVLKNGAFQTLFKPEEFEDFSTFCFLVYVERKHVEKLSKPFFKPEEFGKFVVFRFRVDGKHVD